MTAKKQTPEKELIQISAWLLPEEKAALDTMSKQDRRNRSATLGLLIAAEFKKREKTTTDKRPA